MHGSECAAIRNATPGGEIDWDEVILVTFALAANNEALREAANRLIMQPIRDRAYFTPAELLAAYPPDPVAVAAIEGFAANHGLTMLRGDEHQPLRQMMVPVRDVKDLFGTDLVNYRTQEGKVVRARTGPVSLPARDFNDRQMRGLRGVFGLENSSRAVRRHEPAAGPSAFGGSGPPAAYDFPRNLKGDGQVIGILEFGGRIQAIDLPRILGIHSGPTNAHVVSLTETIAAPSPRFLAESSTDGQIVRRILPNATIVYYLLPDNEQGWIAGMHRILADETFRPSVLSISWGYFEAASNAADLAYWTPAAIDALEDAFARAALLGITVCCCSGDEGVGNPGPSVYYPASSQYALTCGGTKFSGVEEVWCDRSTGGSSGGGISSLIPKPAWQHAEEVRPTSIGLPSQPDDAPAMRMIPDVAAIAQTTVTHWGSVAGTSAAAPLWAALIGGANQQLMEMNLNRRVGNMTALLYDKRTGLQ
ncbi:MAG TPA: protease pro-enzyme activation domain-containing protein, partial [Tepidisphaeraceae bacterium]